MSDYPTESDRALDAGFWERECESCGNWSSNVVDGKCFGCRDGHLDPAYIEASRKRTQAAIAALRLRIEASPRTQAIHAEADRAVEKMKANPEGWAQRVRRNMERDPL